MQIFKIKIRIIHIRNGYLLIRREDTMNPGISRSQIQTTLGKIIINKGQFINIIER